MSGKHKHDTISFKKHKRDRNRQSTWTKKLQKGMGALYLVRNEPPGPQIVLEEKNGCLEPKKYAQADTPVLIRCNTHEVIWAPKDI